ncbi:Hypothetical protein NTJ_09412 [Nesidiocoris tenuis]|uniref:Uncharacterized protein n=1 Tax=Nesidiocoris tenuis TaxID=355587 RepID=A0ABN7B071_9HEMI|nr:Hypothetical protein NTJ_09410 [Nesidiocoris tenuis]BES96600.1 Hypothetical protein NTJ_09412 [Nesidiocoris tenuis]
MILSSSVVIRFLKRLLSISTAGEGSEALGYFMSYSTPSLRGGPRILELEGSPDNVGAFPGSLFMQIATKPQQAVFDSNQSYHDDGEAFLDGYPLYATARLVCPILQHRACALTSSRTTDASSSLTFN